MLPFVRHEPCVRLCFLPGHDKGAMNTSTWADIDKMSEHVCSLPSETQPLSVAHVPD